MEDTSEYKPCFMQLNQEMQQTDPGEKDSNKTSKF